MLLTDPNIEPGHEILAAALKERKEVNFTLENKLKESFDLEYQWRYYNDGKAWLCKVVKKKKTIFWLSVWEDCFKITFYFTEKTQSGIFDLPVGQNIKDLLSEVKHIGKLVPLILEIKNEHLLADLYEIIKYKINIK